jgi:proline dehydrogenase
VNPLRSVFLAASTNPWLRDQATRRRFVRRAVARFMPGESVEDALTAAAALDREGFGTIVTHLGENVSSAGEVAEEVRHYGDVGARIRTAGIDTEISVKLTHFGLDFDPALARKSVAELACGARESGRRLWIDMEGSAYAEPTLALYRELRPAHPNLGVAVQAYLRRSAADIEALIALGAAVRLVKGAYQEPASIAFPEKHDVDESFYALAERLLSAEARSNGAWLAAATHDPRLLARIEALARREGIPANGFEFAMLYGIRRDEQMRLRRAGWRTRVLISYGSSWFPWYMRRLAERPANVGFVLRSLFAA